MMGQEKREKVGGVLPKDLSSSLDIGLFLFVKAQGQGRSKVQDKVGQGPRRKVRGKAKQGFQSPKDGGRRRNGAEIS